MRAASAAEYLEQVESDGSITSPKRQENLPDLQGIVLEDRLVAY
jgi:hypothetical protein